MRVTPTVLNATNIQVSWDIPANVSSQGLSSFNVLVSPECMNGVSHGTTQRYNGDDQTVTMTNFGNLGELYVNLSLCLLNFLTVPFQEIASYTRRLGMHWGSLFTPSLLFRTICSVPSGSHRKRLQHTTHPVQQHSSHPRRCGIKVKPHAVESL